MKNGMGRYRQKRASFNANIQKSLAYKESPFKPNDAQLQEWVSMHRSGTKSFSQEIITAHMRLTMSIVSEFSTPQRAADLEGVALLALVQAVAWAAPHTDSDGILRASRLYTDDITPYICVTIRRFIREFIDSDRSVYMPGRTFRHKAAKGEINQDGENDGMIAGVIRIVANIEGDKISEDSDYTYSVPVAPETEVSPELKELIAKAIRTPQERLIVARRRDGYTYREIAEEMGCHISNVGRICKDVEARFELLYA